MCVGGGGGGCGCMSNQAKLLWWLTRYPVFVDVCELEIV